MGPVKDGGVYCDPLQSAFGPWSSTDTGRPQPGCASLQGGGRAWQLGKQLSGPLLIIGLVTRFKGTDSEVTRMMHVLKRVNFLTETGYKRVLS